MKNSSKPIKADRLFTISLLSYAVVILLTLVLGPGLVHRFYPLLPDAGASWYYWQLPYPTGFSRALVWSGYILHQLVVWLFLITFQKKGTITERSKGLRLQFIFFLVNLLFVLLHLLQTHISYDGLAQDVPIWTSQGSVIVMLVLLLYMMIPVRGLFLGKAFSPPQRLLKVIRKWHGYYISWALVYTFWFHPMEGNWGLLSGFFYMFLLFIQLHMVGTPIHTNRVWVVILESMVAVHGTLITVYKQNSIWPMFLYGFLVLFFFTQLYTFKLRKSVVRVLQLVFVISAVFVYAFIRGFAHVYEITFIPVALYGGALMLLGLGYIFEPNKKKGTNR